MANIDELLEQASEIRDANEEKENTALRVGTMLVNILQYIAGFIDRDTLRQVLQEYASLSGAGLVNWRQSRCVFVATMGTELDNIDGGKWEYTSHDDDIVFNPSSRTLRIVGETSSYSTLPGVIYVNAHTGHLYKWDVSTQKMTELVDSSSPTVIDYRNAPAFADIPIGATYYFLSQSSGYKIGVKVDANNYCSFAIDPKKVYAFRDTLQTAVWNADTQTWTVLSSQQDGSEGSGGGAAGVSAFEKYEAYESINALPGQGVATTGYIVGTHIYAYVSTGGDTKDGKYQDLGTLEAAGVSVSTTEDGTFTIHVGSNSYTVNLNHTHPNMCKLIVCEESDLPSTLDNSTIYAQVDDATDPTEIQSLWIAGLEFVGGGGGSADDGMPKVTSPRDESTLNLGENSGSGVSKSIVVKAKNLNYGGSTTGLTIEAIGTGLSLSYGQQTGQSSITIPQSNGVVNTEITVAFGGSGGLDDGELRFKQGSSVLASVVVVVVEALPAGFVENTAWNGDNMVDSNVDKYSAPGYQEGYVTTPFYHVTHQGYKVDIKIKSGCVNGVDIPKVIFVFKNSPSDANTIAAYIHSSDPMRKTLSGDLGLIQNYISATMKRSELRNCYIYDYVAGAYLFAGANVDTSTPPQ